MKKYITIEVEEYPNGHNPSEFTTPFDREPPLEKIECNNILQQLKGTDTEVAIDYALNILIKYIYENKIYKIRVDLEERNKEYEPPKEMTIKEIEDLLGHRIKIVTEGFEEEW